jgi:hypothetical protein
MSGFKVMAFTVDDVFPTDGTIRFYVPEVYDQNGDNQYRNDDYIELDYTLDSTPPVTTDKQISYGDMNLGQREYRSLHYLKTVEEDDLDNPIMETDPVTGEEKETGNPKKTPNTEIADAFAFAFAMGLSEHKISLIPLYYVGVNFRLCND